VPEAVNCTNFVEYFHLRLQKEMNFGIILVLLLIAESYAAEVVNVVPGIFSKKVVSNGLKLSTSNNLCPANLLSHVRSGYTPDGVIN